MGPFGGISGHTLVLESMKQSDTVLRGWTILWALLSPKTAAWASYLRSLGTASQIGGHFPDCHRRIFRSNHEFWTAHTTQAKEFSGGVEQEALGRSDERAKRMYDVIVGGSLFVVAGCLLQARRG